MGRSKSGEDHKQSGTVHYIYFWLIYNFFSSKLLKLILFI